MLLPGGKMSLVSIEKLYKYFPVRTGLFMRVTGYVQAVHNVSLTINSGETLGLVGESGCGKTTLARTLIRLLKPDAGKIFFEGNDIGSLSANELRPLRSNMQMIFQDPFSSLNPRMTTGDIIQEPLLVHKRLPKRFFKKKVLNLLEIVGLSADDYSRHPGGGSWGEGGSPGRRRRIRFVSGSGIGMAAVRAKV